MTEQTTTPPLAAGQIEIWKKIVDVQQHFNDLELRIRNFALIVTGAFLGLGGYAIKDGGMVTIFSLKLSLAGLVVYSAVFPLLAFYFMDRLWYHRLLDGSVQAGIQAETALKELGYKVDLGTKITEKSPFPLWVFGTKIHSRTKMDIFYLMLVAGVVFVGSSLAFGVHSQPASALPLATSSVLTDIEQTAIPTERVVQSKTDTNTGSAKAAGETPDASAKGVADEQAN